MGTSNTTWVAGLLVVAILVSAMATMTVVTKSTGFATEQDGTLDASVAATAVITMVTSDLDFGAINVGQTMNATTDVGYPFAIDNDGNANINITLGATALWTRAVATSNKYRFACTTAGGNSCPDGSTTGWTDVPIGGSALVTANLNQTARTTGIDIEITAPTDEPAGSKSSTVTFTGSLA